MIDSAAAVYSITYPSGQSRSFYDSLLNEMLTFYLEKETAKMKAFPGVARQYFRGYREYFRGGYREYGTVRVLLLYTKKELIAADFALCDSSLTSMTLQAVNLDIINFEDFMGSFQARSGYFSLSALTQPPPSTDKTNADNPPADSSGAEDQDQSE